jgi:hypothetical protein
MYLVIRLRLPQITFPLPLLFRTQFQPLQMFAQGIPHERGTIALRPARSLVCCLQELLIENNLNGFHMWTLFHSILHIRFEPDDRASASTLPSWPSTRTLMRNRYHGCWSPGPNKSVSTTAKYSNASPS